MDHRLDSGSLSVLIRRHGAEMASVKNKEGVEYVWQAGESWQRHAPVLFPIVGRLKDDTYFFEGKSYKLPQHGFARDKDFKLKDNSAGQCTYELRADHETRKIYPFDFVFHITYKLKDKTLTCEYVVRNEGKNKMLFSLGAHPGFRCPLVAGESFSDYYLEFEQRSFLQTALKGGLRTNETRVLPLHEKQLPLTKNLFDQDALVFEKGQVNTISLVSRKSGHRVTVNCSGWPFFGIWSKKGNEEFVCLEPWYGVADHVISSQQLEEKDGIITLGPGAEFRATFEMVFA